MSLKTKIGIVDYGLGNVGSIQNMLKKIGYHDVCVVKNKNDFNKVSKLILPGVGAFDTAMKKIQDSFGIEYLKDQIINKKQSTLGICLGMQVLANDSEEGCLKGLELIDCSVKKIIVEEGTNLKIPHMGWNYVKTEKENLLMSGLENKDYYFVHSYYVDCNNQENVLMTTNYHKDFASVISRDNIYGVQFHPEKSHKHGMKLLKNFVELC